MDAYAGRSQDERVAMRTGRPLRSLEPPGGRMAVDGTRPDETHSCGQLSEEGKAVWRTGSGIDGGGMSR